LKETAQSGRAGRGALTPQATSSQPLFHLPQPPEISPASSPSCSPSLTASSSCSLTNAAAQPLSLGPNQVLVPKIEWMSQALLMVDTVNAENLVEITVFGRPTVQHRVKNVLLSLASRHREHRARAEKMEQLEEFLKHPVA
uniref:KH-like RNA-binding domain-containing protein n=1 Tax=Sus scrofa TaxID=9823 RepID=A0A4X1V7L5_PIG